MENIKDLTIKDLEGYCSNKSWPKYRAKQIFKWIYRGIKSIDEMSDIPIDYRQILKSDFYIGKLIIEKRLESKIDGTKKYLLKLNDGNLIEGVLMKYSFGVSACLSTQVGCNMGCIFCASTIGGKVRNLTAGEMVDELITMQNDIKDRISNIVLMGIGEPLDNYDNVVKFLNIINSDDGLNIGMRHITLSTCGLVPGIERLAKEDLQITLAISLHASDDATRRSIMPIANKYSIEEIINACRSYIEKTSRRITFEYALIEGVNDRPKDAERLSKLLRGMLCHVNLIPINEIEERKYKKPELGKLNEFKGTLESRGIETTIRREMGSDINAACGQLRKKNVK